MKTNSASSKWNRFSIRLTERVLGVVLAQNGVLCSDAETRYDLVQYLSSFSPPVSPTLLLAHVIDGLTSSLTPRHTV